MWCTLLSGGEVVLRKGFWLAVRVVLWLLVGLLVLWPLLVDVLVLWVLRFCQVWLFRDSLLSEKSDDDAGPEGVEVRVPSETLFLTVSEKAQWSKEG